MTDATDPAILAHRGFAGVNPENTVGAVRAAAPRADMVEVDVRACRDGTPVVFHDARLDAGGESRGVTDRQGAVRESSPGTVTAAEVFGSGETVPSLSTLVAATEAPLNVELKAPRASMAGEGKGAEAGANRDDRTDEAAETPPSTDRWRPLVDRVLDALDGRRVLVSSFHEGALAAVRERDPSLSLAALCRDPEEGTAVATRRAADAVHPAAHRVDAAAVATAHGAGLAVNAWTVRTWREAAALVRAGVDGLIADYPGLDRWVGEGETRRNGDATRDGD